MSLNAFTDQVHRVGPNHCVIVGEFAVWGVLLWGVFYPLLAKGNNLKLPVKNPLFYAGKRYKRQEETLTPYCTLL